GSNRITIFQPWGGNRQGASIKLDLETTEALLLGCPAARAVSPLANARGRVAYLRNNQEVPIRGVLPEFFSVENFEIEHGRAIKAQDLLEGARVVVLAFKTANDLFGERDPVGEEVRLNGKAFTVIGTLKEKGALPWQNLDEQVMVPLITLQRSIEKSDSLQRITIQAKPGEDPEALQAQIEEVLQHRFPAFAKNPDLIYIRNQAEQQEEQEKAANLIQGFLIVIGGIALFIGGIGIMNIMLVTVSERTAEIGLRKALGATREEILGQFLIESLVLCLASGALGVGVGVYIIGALAKYSQSETAQLPAPILNHDAVLWSVAVSAGIAIVFGLLPAINASRLEPVQALRME
ncbi:MAG: ABC transporter permease, partial [bacterium]